MPISPSLLFQSEYSSFSSLADNMRCMPSIPCCHASTFGMTITGRLINIIFIWWVNLFVSLTSRPHSYPTPVEYNPDGLVVGISHRPTIGVIRYSIMPSAIRRRHHFRLTCSANATIPLCAELHWYKIVSHDTRCSVAIVVFGDICLQAYVFE